MTKKIDYKNAGVDVTKGYEAVKKIKPHVEKTFTSGVLSNIGSFAALFELPSGYKKPVLVSATDGVGTKLQLAFKANMHNTIGIDCVAMCTNDLICLGAKPLFFLDYIGTGILDPEQVALIVEGISNGCVQSGCALIGGETAEMPGFYKKNEYDLAGFSVGIIEKDKIIDGSKIEVGDKIIGIASSGLHSNGFSLVRKLIFEKAKIKLTDYSEELKKTYQEELLTPTTIYVSLILNLLKKYDIKGIAHITGGGWLENIPRILKTQHKAVVKPQNVEKQTIFSLLQNLGNLTENDMYNTFNMGVGLVLIVGSHLESEILQSIQKTHKAYCLGEIASKQSSESDIEFV